MAGQNNDDSLDKVLSQVKQSRRTVLKKVLIGAGAAAFVAPFSTLASAQDPETPPEGRGKGKGDGKGKGGGKGKGKGAEGRGSGDGRGRGKNPVQGERGGRGREGRGPADARGRRGG